MWKDLVAFVTGIPKKIYGIFNACILVIENIINGLAAMVSKPVVTLGTVLLAFIITDLIFGGSIGVVNFTMATIRDFVFLITNTNWVTLMFILVVSFILFPKKV